jgi:hypothetical protein
MRNVSLLVHAHCIVDIHTDQEVQTAYLNYLLARLRLCELLECRPHAKKHWTPSERRVMRDFACWFRRVTRANRKAYRMDLPSFFYWNANTSKGVFFIPTEGYGDFHIQGDTLLGNASNHRIE